MNPDDSLPFEPIDSSDDDLTLRIAKFRDRALAATTPADLLVVLIEAGWGLNTSDPPIRTWPAYRAILPIFEEWLADLRNTK